MKILTNEQRTRLEAISNDEFSMRQREIEAERAKGLKDWEEKAIAKASKDPIVKKYLETRKSLDKICKALNLKGIRIDHQMDTDKATVSLLKNPGYNNSRPFPGYKEQMEKSKVDYNSLTRAKNEVLSVIWSMEKPFDECIKLIKDKVNKIK